MPFESLSEPYRMKTAPKFAILTILLAGSTLGIAGVDLVLPAIPTLPEYLGGSASSAQFVLASFAAGIGLGMLLFGRLSDRYDPRFLLTFSFLLYGATSLGCAAAHDMTSLIVLRFFQGAAGSAAAVFAPGIIRSLLEPPQAVRALGLMGSIEALVPAFAPLLGAFLLQRLSWRASFALTGSLALILTFAALILRRSFPKPIPKGKAGSFLILLRKGPFLRYCLSQAFVLGGLLTFVFGAPAVIVKSMNGTLADFILMQIIGVASFACAANFAQNLVDRWGVERSIMFGTCLAAVSGLALLAYALASGATPWHLIPLFVPMNIGLGLRGPPGFFRAIVAADGDDARASALVILAVMGTSALGTAIAAPFIEKGLPALTGVTAALVVGAVFALLVFPALREGEV